MKKPLSFLIFNDIVWIQQRQPFADEFYLFRNFIQFLFCHFALLLYWFDMNLPVLSKTPAVHFTRPPKQGGFSLSAAL